MRQKVSMPLADMRLKILNKYRKMASFEGCTISFFDDQSSDGDTPIHAAAFLNNVDDLRVMIKDNVDINVRGDIGNTALHYAAMKGNSDVVMLLLEAGCNPNLVNDYGDTPLDFVRGEDSALTRILSEWMAKT